MGSENGFCMWGLIMKEWAATKREGLPAIENALHGCVYDSCSTYGLYPLYFKDSQAEAYGAEQIRGYVRHTVLRSIMGLATRVLPPDSDCITELAINGPIAQSFEVWYGRNNRGHRDDPLFFDFWGDWHGFAQMEPPAIPRICYYSEADMIVNAQGIRASAEWSKSARGREMEMVHYENTLHCEHHLLDNGKIYFNRLDSWIRAVLPTLGLPSQDEVSSQSTENLTLVTNSERKIAVEPEPCVTSWEVFGGADKGGIVVRAGEDLKSQAFDERLATGSLIESVELRGQRLQYTLVSGSGPSEGWISLKVGGKDLVRPQPKNIDA